MKSKAHLMIMTLGGSPEPLIKSIHYHKPDKIIFLASQDSILRAGDILKSLDFRPLCEFEITENPNSMFDCYVTARRCVDRAKKMAITAEHTVVDYTGGTKVMTAALILATIGEPYHFNYVGGEKRDKDGVGVVIDGFETMYPEMSPWSIFAEEERRQVLTLFNSRRFSAAIRIIDLCDRPLPRQIRDYFDFVRPMAEGFLFWDQFDHRTALRRLKSGHTALTDYLETYRDPTFVKFVEEIDSCREHLDLLIARTDNLKIDRILVKDLINNARRRMADRRYDDAAARLYRALELYGQIAFYETAGCPNDRVPRDVLPDTIREEFFRKYGESGEKPLKLPLTATFRYLQVVGHEAGIRFFEQLNEIKNIQSNRNYSILAHGIKPISEKAAESIFKTVVDFVGEKEFFDFPTLP